MTKMANRLPHLPVLGFTLAALILGACRDATPRPGIPTPQPAVTNDAAPSAPASATEVATPIATSADNEAAPAPEPTAIDPAKLASAAALPAVVKVDPAALGINVEPVTVAGVVDPLGTPFVEAGLPAHVRLVFGGIKPDTARVNPREAQVLVIPIAGYLAKFAQMPELQEEVRAQIDELKKFLKDRTITDAETITVLPPFNAAQLIHSRIEYLNLPNGQGVRFLTAYATDPAPITSADLFYTFQGFTNDGLYYIAAFFPLETSTLTKLPANVAAAEADEAANRFGDYLARITQQLDGANNGNFKPSLDALDTVMRSIDPLATAPGAVAPTAPPAVTAEPTATTAQITAEPTLAIIEATLTPDIEPTVAATVAATAVDTPEATLEPAATDAPAAAEATNTARPVAQLQSGRTTTVVNLRSAASTRARIIMRVQRNTTVTILGRNANNNWLRVRLRNGRVGWMAAAYVRGVNLRRVPVVR